MESMLIEDQGIINLQELEEQLKLKEEKFQSGVERMSPNLSKKSQNSSLRSHKSRKSNKSSKSHRSHHSKKSRHSRSSKRKLQEMKDILTDEDEEHKEDMRYQNEDKEIEII